MPSSEMNDLPTCVSGAMIPVKWDKGSQYVMKRNDNWFRGKAYLTSYVFKVDVPAVADRQPAQDGRDRRRPSSTPSQWDALANVAEHRPGRFYPPRLTTTTSTTSTPARTPKAAIFGDSRCARLCHRARPQEGGRQGLFRTGRTPPTPHELAQWAHTTTKTQYPYDAGQGRQMLDAAGWKKGPTGFGPRAASRWSGSCAPTPATRSARP